MSFKARFSMFSKVLGTGHRGSMSHHICGVSFQKQPENDELSENITSSNLPCVKAGHVYTFPP
jgi:hypothetical protein